MHLGDRRTLADAADTLTQINHQKIIIISANTETGDIQYTFIHSYICDMAIYCYPYSNNISENHS